MKLGVKTNAAQFAKKELWTIKGNLNKAAVRTLNRVGKGAPGAGIKNIRRNVNIKAKAIRKHVHYDKATRRRLTYSVKVRSSKHGIPVVNYGARDPKKGVSVEIKRGNRILIRGAFMATMKSGHKGVYLRKKSWEHKLVTQHPKKYHGLPIYEKFGPDAVDLFDNRNTFNAMRKYIYEQYPKEFRRNLKRINKKK